jgi:hypothetical protein
MSCIFKGDLSRSCRSDLCFGLVIYSGYLGIVENRTLDRALGFKTNYLTAIQYAIDLNYPATLGSKDDLKWIIERKLSLTKINVSPNSGWGGGILRDKDFLKISHTCPNLIICDLNSNIHLTDESIAIVLNKCSNLRELSMKCMVRINGCGFNSVTKKLPALKKLDFTGCLYLEDQYIAPFTTHIPNLSFIAFGDNQRITDTTINALAIHCNNLESIHFERMIYVTDESISLLIQRCSQLREITLNAIYNMRQKFEAIRLLDLCPMLEVIVLQTLDDSFEIEDNTVQHMVTYCPMIKQLHLYSEHIHSNSYLTGKSIQTISDKLQGLVYLRLDVDSSTKFPDDLFLEDVTKLPTSPLECLVKKCLDLKCADIRRNGGGLGDWFYQVIS